MRAAMPETQFMDPGTHFLACDDIFVCDDVEKFIHKVCRKSKVESQNIDFRPLTRFIYPNNSSNCFTCTTPSKSLRSPLRSTAFSPSASPRQETITSPLLTSS